jgi:hypothetical protein
MKSRVKAKPRGRRKSAANAAAKAKPKVGTKPSRKAAKARTAPAKSAGTTKPPPKTDPLDQWIMAGTSALGLRVEKSWVRTVRTNLKVTLDMAEAVAAFPLPDDAEPAPVFRA